MTRLHPRAARALLAISLLAPAPLAAQGAFEGVVDYRLRQDDGSTITSTSYVKGNKTRSEMSVEGHTAVMIMDNDKGQWITLMPEQKQYVVMDIRKMAEAAKAMPQEKDDGAMKDFSFRATGRKETIAGITCEHYLMSVAKGETAMDMCLAKGMGSFMGMWGGAGVEAMGGGAPARGGAMTSAMKQAERTMKDGAFLLKLETSFKGKRQMTMEATRVVRQKVDAALLAPPAGYTLLDTEKMMREAMRQRPPARQP